MFSLVLNFHKEHILGVQELHIRHQWLTSYIFRMEPLHLRIDCLIYKYLIDEIIAAENFKSVVICNIMTSYHEPDVWAILHEVP